ncbi:hypothetical protein [Kitasatospora sp. NPDC088134]|uniref:hypothetical protein n=1 Tax=Kitasatospora sp. NPDC088134 TaxID=3364071 RepID=UPI0038038EFE
MATAVGLLATGCSQHSDQPVQHVQAKWAPGYGDVKELDAHSDLAVAGRFSKNLGEKTDNNGVTRTDFEFTITKQLSNHKGDAVGAKTILIRQTGGKNIQSEDDTLFQEDEKAVLFLREFAPGQYAVISGPNGRFNLTDPKGVTGQAAASTEATVSPFNNETAKFSGSLGQLTTLLGQ